MRKTYNQIVGLMRDLDKLEGAVQSVAAAERQALHTLILSTANRKFTLAPKISVEIQEQDNKDKNSGETKCLTNGI